MSNQPTIRPATPDDAGELLALRLQLDRETRFMMYEPGERPDDIDLQRREIQGISARENATLLLVHVGNRLAGLVEVDGGIFRRNRHSATIVIGILQEFSGRGIGNRLLEEAEAWAVPHGIHRLELTVMTHNQAAIRLYRRRGFEIEGTRRDSLRVDGIPTDEYLMAKLI